MRSVDQWFGPRSKRLNASCRTLAAAVVVGAWSLVAGPRPAVAQAISLTTTGTYSQNFDSLFTSGTTWTNGSTIAGWFAERGGGTALAGVIPSIIVGSGSASSGGVYSFGSPGTTGAALDRALGSLGSGTPGSLAYGVEFRNNAAAGTSLTLGTLSFTGEQWRNGGNASSQSLSLWYKVSTTDLLSTGTFLTPTDNSGWTQLSSLTFTSLQNTATAAALDGNATANRTTLAQNIGSVINVGAGQYLAFRWLDINDSGNDHGLAIDDFSLSYTVSLLTTTGQFWTASSTSLGGPGTWGSGNTWSASDTAVSGGAYDPAKNAIFKGAGGTVTVDAGGVASSGGLQFSSGGYTIAGGAISLSGSVNTVTVDDTISATVSAAFSGSNGFTKQGAGTLVLGGTSAALSGTIGINGGTLQTATADALGGNSSATTVNLFGGTLRTTADTDLGSRQLAIVSGNVAPDVGTKLTYAGDMTSVGGLVLAGSGTFALTSANAKSIGLVTLSAPGTLDASTGGQLSLTSGISATYSSGTGQVLGNANFGASAGSISVAEGGTLRLAGQLINNSGTAVRSVSKTGGGTLVLDGDNSSTLGRIQLGSAVTTNGGTIRISNGGALGTNEMYFNYGTLEATAPVTIGSSFFGVLTGGLSIGGREATRARIAGSDVDVAGNVTAYSTVGTGDLVLEVNNRTTFSGAVTMASTANIASFKVAGSGTLRLTGDMSALNKPVSVAESATLSVESSLAAAGLVSVSGSATVTGNSTVGPLAVNAGGRLAPGVAGVGMLSAGDTTFNSGGNYTVQVADATGGAGTGWDFLNISGALTISASSASPFNINLWSLAGSTSGSAVNFSPGSSYTWKIATASSGVSGFSGDKFAINTSAINGSDGFANALAGGSFKATNTGNDLNVVFTPFTPGTTVTWYGNGVAAGGSGTWSALGSNWSDGGTVGTWDPARTAVFNATSGTVTVAAGGITANRGLQFDSTGYSVTGGAITLGGTSADANAISVASAATATIGSALAGSNGLAKTGFGTLVLTGSNAVSGGAQVREGTLQVGEGSAAGSLPGAVSIDTGATLAFNKSSNDTVGATLSGAGAVVQKGSGDLRLTGANSGLSGGVRAEAGSVTVGASGALGTAATTVTAGSLYVESGVTNAAPIVVQSTATVTPFTSLYWDFGSGTTPSAQPLSGVPTGLTIGDLTRVNTGTTDPLLSVTSPSSGYAGASGSYNAGLIAARTLTVISGTTPAFEFTLTPQAGSRVDLTSISFGSRSTGSGPASYELRSSADGYSAALATWTSTGTAGYADSTWRLLSGSSFAVSSGDGTPVSYRLFGFGNTGSGVISAVNWRIDDLTLGGRMTSGSSAAIAIGTRSTSGTALFTGQMTLDRTVPLTAPAGGTARFEGAIVDGAGANGVQKTGAGTVVLAGNNTYRGATTVSEGTLVVTGVTSASEFTVQNGATLAGNGTVGAVTMTAGATLSPGVGIGTLSAGSTVLAGAAALDWQLYNAGGASPAGNWDLLNVTGGITVNATSGSPFAINLRSASDAAGTSGNVILFDPGVAARWTFATTTSGVTGFDPTKFTLSTAGFTNSLSGGTFSVGLTADSLGLDIIFTPSAAASSLVWYGNGSTAGGSGAWNSADARWAPVGGGAAGAWQTAKTAIFDTAGGTVTVDAGGISANNGLRFDATGYTITGGGVALGGSALANTITVATAATAEIGSVITAGSGVTKSGDGTLVLAADNPSLAGATVSAGTLQIGKGSTAGSLAGAVAVAGGASLAFNRSGSASFAGPISGAGRLVKDGVGTLTLTGSNGFSGGTVVNAGAVVVGDGSTNGSLASTGDATIAAGAELAFNRADTGTFAGAVAGAGKLSQIGTGTLVLSRTGTANAYGSAFTLRVANGTVDLNRGGPSLVGIVGTGNTIELAGGALQLTANSGSGATVSAAAIDVQADSTIAMNRVGSAANHTTTGITTPITIRNNSKLTFDYRGLIGTSTTGVVYAGATTYTGTVSLASNATIEVTNSAGGSGDVTFAGPVVGSFALTKTGNQSLTLSGSNSYSGPTTVDAGTLRVAGYNAASAITVNSGAVLTGGGTAGGVTINAGATLAPGSAVGTLTAGNVVWNGGGNYNWAISSGTGLAGSQWDLLNGTGSLAINATTGSPFNVNLWTLGGASLTTGTIAGFDAAINRSWTIGTFAAGITGFASNLFNVVTGSANGTGGFSNALDGTFSIAQSGNSLNLVYTSNAPQPGRYWDANGATAGVGGSGTWSATSQSFAPDLAGTSVNSLASSGDAVFAGTAGTVTVGGTVTPPGGMQFSTTGYVVNGGVIALAAGTSTLTADVGVAATIGATLGQATTSAAVVKAGEGAITLGGGNTFAGGATVAAGTLTAASNVALGAGNATVSGSGSLLAAAGVTLSNAITVSGSAGSGGSGSLLAGWDFQTAPGTVVTTNTSTPATPTSYVANFGSGTLSLNGANGSSTWTVAATNSELNGFGGTTVNAGGGFSTVTTAPAALALIAGGSSAGGFSANGKSAVFTVDMSGKQDLTISYATQKTSTGFDTQSWSYSTDGTNWITLQSISGTAIPTSFGAVTLNPITGLNGASTAYVRLTVSGATASGGNNRLDNVQFNVLGGPAPAPGPVVATATIGSNAVGGIAEFAGPITLGGNVNLTAASVGTVTFSGTILGGGGIRKTGDGAVVLSADAGYTGGTTVEAGQLRLGAGGTTGSLVGGVQLLAPTASLVIDRSDDLAFATAVSGSGGLFKEGGNTVTMTGSNSYTGGTTLFAGTVVVGNGGTQGSIAADGPVDLSPGTTLAFDRSDDVSLSGAVTGDGTLVQTGLGRLTLSQSGSLGNVSLRVESGVVALNRGGGSLVGSLNAGNTVQLAGGTLELTSDAGEETKFVGASIQVESDSTIAINRTGSPGDHSTTGFAAPITMATTGTLTFDYRGAFSSNTVPVVRYKGTTTYTGTVTLASAAGFGVTNSSGGTAEVVFAGPVVDGGAAYGLTKLGDQKLTLSAANSYGGRTVVGEGTLALGGSGSIGSSPEVNIAAGAIFDVTAKTGGYTVPATQALAGAGTVAGSIAVGSAATLSPGSGIGVLSVTQGVTWANAGNFNWQIASATGTAGGWDLLDVGGALDISATAASPFRINLWSLASGTGGLAGGPVAGFDAAQNWSWKIATATGGITGFSADKFQVNATASNGAAGFANGLAGGTFSVAKVGNDLNLVFTKAGGQTSPAVITVGSGTSQSQATALSGTTGFEKAGGGTLVLDQANALTGPTTVAAGTLQLGNAGALASSPVTVAAGATLAVGPQVEATLPSLVNNGLVDVGLGKLTVAGGQTAEGVLAGIMAGRNGGTWDGATGIASSGAALSGDRAVGWLDNGDGSFTIGFAAPGDLDMNGVVDFDDVFAFVTSGLYDTGGSANWSQGDYDYNGIVDFDDVFAFVTTGLYDAGGYNPATRSSRLMQLARGGVSGGLDGASLFVDPGSVVQPLGNVAAVPEPSAWALAAGAAGSLLLMVRRRGATTRFRSRRS